VPNPNSSKRRPPVRRSQFRESLPAAVPNRTYRSKIEAPSPTAAQVIVRIIATVLGALLAIRFIIELFTTSRSLLLARSIFELTDWAVWPFQRVIGASPQASAVNGTFDWSVVLALLVIIGLAWYVLAKLRRDPYDR
jgi:YGGT family